MIPYFEISSVIGELNKMKLLGLGSSCCSAGNFIEKTYCSHEGLLPKYVTEKEENLETSFFHFCLTVGIKTGFKVRGKFGDAVSCHYSSRYDMNMDS